MTRTISRRMRSALNIFRIMSWAWMTGSRKPRSVAEAICGVPARQIKALARNWAKENTSIAHGNGGSYIRSTYSHEPARLEVCLLGMQALGKPGRNQLKMMEYQLFSLGSQMPAPRSSFIPGPGIDPLSLRGRYAGIAGSGDPGPGSPGRRLFA